MPHAFALLVAVLALLLGTLACVEENPREVSLVIS
jgi:hypothetical protein